MFDRDLISKSHFTSKEDTRFAFGTFVRDMQIQDEIPPFEYEEGMTTRGKRIVFSAVSWGGYEDKSGRWCIFVAYRAAAIGVTRQYRWFWDAENQQPYCLQIFSFVQ